MVAGLLVEHIIIDSGVPGSVPPLDVPVTMHYYIDDWYWDRQGAALVSNFIWRNVWPVGRRKTRGRSGRALSLIHISEPTRPY